MRAARTRINPALRSRLADLLDRADRGHIDSEPEPLAVLCHLAAAVLNGATAEQARALASWYDTEAAGDSVLPEEPEAWCA
jgi:hypothetical protein